MIVELLIAFTVIGFFVDRIFYRWKISQPPKLKQVPKQGPLDRELHMSATELCRELRSGKLRSVDVVRKHIEHIQAVNPYLNAVVFDRFDLAMEEARKADLKLQQWRAQGSPQEKLPPWLTGVPCTIKECFAVKGCPNTAGHPNRVGLDFPTKDAPAVARLRKAGVIVLGVTNLSEMCMWMESGNHVYGITRNPYDTRHIVGGSSGGEGAVVAAHFAPFGLGSDIGGSIRMPAYFNGVFGHKPSTRLIPNAGQHPGVKTDGHFLLVTGPICRYMEDVLPLMETLSEGGFLEDKGKYPWCPSKFALSPIQIGAEFSPNKPHGNKDPLASSHNRHRTASRAGSPTLKVYAFTDLGFPGITTSPLQRQAVEAAAAALERTPGVTVHRFNLKHKKDFEALPKGWQLIPNAAQHWAAMVAKDEVHFEDLMGQGYPNGEFPAWKELGKWFLNKSKHTLPSIGLCILERIQHKVVPSSFDQSNFEEGQILKRYLWQHLADDGIIIAPTYPVPPPRHHKPLFKPVDWQYTSIFNAMEMPSTAVPIWLDRESQKLPLGVQVAAGWGHDMLAISAANDIVQKLGGAHPPSWAH